MKKTRADTRLVELGLAANRSKAQARILAGQVFTPTGRVSKPGDRLPADVELRVTEEERYCSRGGLKLEGALAELLVNVNGVVAADIGASTGGFTDCLLQHGARRVYAVDVGHGQLAERLRQDPRVVVMDRTNARHLEPQSFGEMLDFAVVDASFISLVKLLPALSAILPPGARLLALIKPQFEVGREQAARTRGVVRDPELRRSAVEAVLQEVAAAGFERLGDCASRLAGPKGNVEHFVLARRVQVSTQMS